MTRDVSLIIKTHAFGDALLCTPAAKELIERGGRWQVLTGPSAAPVWERMAGVERIYTAPFPPSNKSDYANMLRWSVRNRKNFKHIGRAYVFQASPAVRRWVRFLTGSTIRSIAQHPLGSWERVFPAVPDEFIGDAYARLTEFEINDRRPLFELRKIEKVWVEKLGIKKPYVVCSAGGGVNPRDTVPEKRWKVNRYAEIIRRLSEEGFNIVLLGGADDLAVSDELEQTAGIEILNLVGRTTWGQSGAVLGEARCYIGNDSGIAHLSTAVGTSTVVVFGPTAPQCLYAPGLITPVVSETACSPCYSNRIFPGCTQSSVRCMEDIDVGKTWSILRGVIHEDNSS